MFRQEIENQKVGSAAKQALHARENGEDLKPRLGEKKQTTERAC